jgi:hypothetical protein
MLRKLLVAAACAAVMAAAGTTAAFAGEVTGPFPNGTPLWTGTITDPATGEVVGHTLHGNSECAFSGLNIPSEDGEPGRTQSYGQTVNALKAAGVSPNQLRGIPGTACNPTKSSGGE